MQKDEQDKEGNKFWVVLPKGQIERAVFTLMWAFTCTLLFQIAVFIFFPAKPWIFFLTYFVLLISTTLGGSSLKGPSRYEMGLAWVAQHSFLAFLILGVLTALSQVYCCRRFIQTEITS